MTLFVKSLNKEATPNSLAKLGVAPNNLIVC